MPESQAPTARRKKRRKKRAVFVVARPLRAAGVLSFSSDGKFPICHWGLFTVDTRHAEISSQWTKFRETRDPCNLPPHGTMIELVRLPGNINSHNLIDDFGLEQWDDEWKYVAIQYVGDTDVSDGELATEASNITRMYPDYDGYTNNCQNFVRYLLAFACQDHVAPNTIEHAVYSLFTDLTANVYAASESVRRRCIGFEGLDATSRRGEGKGINGCTSGLSPTTDINGVLVYCIPVVLFN
jgi:hypothetical protein